MSIQADYTAQGELVAAKRVALNELYQKADKESDPAKRDELAGSIKTANTELNAEVDKLVSLEELVAGERKNSEAMKALRRSPRQIDSQDDNTPDEESEEAILSAGAKSVGSLVKAALAATGRKTGYAGGDGFRGFRGSLGELSINGFKTLIQSSSLAPLSDRQAIVPYAVEEQTVADLMLQGTTGAQVVDYYEETTFTNSAAETAEAAAKPESALDFTLRQENVRKIATWIPVTDEMLADVPAFESYIRQRLAFMVKRREEAELLTGNGTSPNLQGIVNRTGVQTVTGYGLSTLDSIYKGITNVRANAFAEPTAFVVHPQDWFDIRTSKDTTGQYLLGPANSEGDFRIWGLQVRVTTAMTQDTGLVGAFRPHAQIFRRSGIDIAISTENEDYFLKNKVAVRAEERLALAVYRPAAFCKVEALVQGS